MLLSDKTDFKAKNITKDKSLTSIQNKKRCCSFFKEIHFKRKTIKFVYTNKILKYIQLNGPDLQGEIDKSTITVANFKQISVKVQKDLNMITNLF